MKKSYTSNVHVDYKCGTLGEIGHRTIYEHEPLCLFLIIDHCCFSNLTLKACTKLTNSFKCIELVIINNSDFNTNIQKIVRFKH